MHPLMGAGRRCLAVHLRSHAVDPWVFVSVRPRSFPFTGVRFRWWASAFVGGRSSPSVRGWLRLVLPCKWERGRGGCCLPGFYPSLAILVCPRSFVVGCHVANGDVVPVSCVKEGEGGDIRYSPLHFPSFFIVVVEHLPLVATSPTATWPLLLV